MDLKYIFREANRLILPIEHWCFATKYIDANGASGPRQPISLLRFFAISCIKNVRKKFLFKP